MTKYLLVITLILAISVNNIAARNFWKRQAGDDPTVDAAAAAAAAPNTDASIPSTDGAPGTDAVAPGTEPMTNPAPDTGSPVEPTGTEVSPDSAPQSEAPASPSLTTQDLGSATQGETSGPLSEQAPSEPAGMPMSEMPGSIPPESVNTIEAGSPGSPPAVPELTDAPPAETLPPAPPAETQPPAPEQTVGVTSESGAAATAPGSEPVVQPGSEPTSGVPGSEAAPVASIVPESETAVVVDTGTPVVVSEGVPPQVVTVLQPVPVVTIGSGSDNPGVTGVKGTVVANLGDSTGGPVPTEDADVFPFQGGFVFDSPFFSFAQIEDYFKKLEKAMEKIFRDTIKDVNSDSDLYKNTTERVVDVDGTRYKVHTTIIRGGDENNAVSIEAVSAIPESKRRKRSLF